MKNMQFIGNVFKIRELENSTSITLAVNEKSNSERSSDNRGVLWVNVIESKERAGRYDPGDFLFVEGDFTLSTFIKDGVTRINVTLFCNRSYRIFHKKKNDLPEREDSINN